MARFLRGLPRAAPGTHPGRTRLRLPALRRISPLDDAPPSESLDLLVIVTELPQQGPGVLANLGGGLIESGRQGEFDQPAITQVLADDRMIHFHAQSIGLGVRMVQIELSLRGFVGPDTADVGFQQ